MDGSREEPTEDIATRRAKHNLRFKKPDRSYLSDLVWKYCLRNNNPHGLSALRAVTTSSNAPTSPVSTTTTNTSVTFPIGDKHMYDSFCEVVLPFGNDAVLREEYKSFTGGLRFGKLMEDLDCLAASIAYLHCDDADLTIVTAAVDRIELLNDFSRCDLDVRLRGFVTYVGKSSMEVTIAIESHHMTSEEEWSLNAMAKFVFVARTKDASEAVTVPRLLVDTQREKDIVAMGAARHQYRLRRSEQSLFRQPPTAEESALLHKLLIGGGSAAGTCQVPMKSTEMTSIRLCHPQERNVHNLIFGGHLMREAFELAYSTALLFTEGQPIKISTVDDISFSHPVHIGSLLSFGSRIVFTEMRPEGEQNIHVEVTADVIDPTTNARVTTNTFHYTFVMAASNNAPIRTVIPATYTEAMKYLEGMRRVQFNHSHPFDQPQ